MNHRTGNAYRKRKPNYWPEPPPDPEFGETANNDPYCLEIIRFLVIALFIATLIYCVFAWAFTNHTIPTFPNITLNSITIPYYNLNVTTQTLSIRCSIEFSIHNPNKEWRIKHSQILIELRYLYYIYNDLAYKKVISKQNANTDLPFSLELETAYLGLEDTNSTKLLAEHLNRGMVPVLMIITLSSEFIKQTWPRYNSKFCLGYYCLPNVSFSSSGVGTLLGEPITCHLNSNHTDSENTKKDRFRGKMMEHNRTARVEFTEALLVYYRQFQTVYETEGSPTPQEPYDLFYLF